MTFRTRPCVESLEDRRLLSTANARIASNPVGLNFAGPSPTGQLVIFGPLVFEGPVHALANQQASSVTLTLKASGRRRPGESIQVEVATGPLITPPTAVPSAQPGVQYQPVVETITFPPGVTSEPVTIPIVAGAANPGVLSFQVTATQIGVASNSGVGGRTTKDVFLARNINAPVPRIDGASMIVRGRRTSDFVLHFSQPMDPASVQSINSYYLQDSTFHTHAQPLFSFGPNFPTSAPTVLKTATYDPSTNTVDLHLAHPVDSRDAIQIKQSSHWFGSGQPFTPNTNFLLDASGTRINEDGSGLGGAFLITLTSKKATLVDGVTQSVIPAAPVRG